MEKFDELLEKLENCSVLQKSGDWRKDIPNDIWNDYFKNNFEVVAGGLYVDKHRWYETSIDVIKIFGRFLGIESVTDLFSEQMTWADCDAYISFSEMEETKIVTYKYK